MTSKKDDLLTEEEFETRLRDMIAIRAIRDFKVFESIVDEATADSVAQRAYLYADAMIRARKNIKPTE